MVHVPRRAPGWCGLLLMVMMAGCGAAMAAENPAATMEASASAGVYPIKQFLSTLVDATLALSVGLRFDAFDWSIAGTPAGTHPNIRSELEWSQVLSHQVALSGRARVGRHFYCRGQINYAAIQSGTVRDSDYDGDNRTQEFSRSISDTNDDRLWDVVAGVGYPFTFYQGRLLLAPMVGLSVHKQNFRITNGFQVISERPPPDVGPFAGRLNSTYQALWWGPWVGGDVRYRLPAPPDQAPPMEWGLALMYHFRTDFSAEANWNLRPDLRQPVSFDQEADAHGLSLHAEWLLRVTRHFHLCLLVNYTRWTTDPGTDTFYYADGRTYTTRLNRVTWTSHEVMLGIAYRFF